mmetsp:Transcript_5812/g.18481  ORF Transcript_5812/g.18481 Transcript_5812/m.18481 type:complete len:328 (-) Transcript_5812:548-1531(-)
MAMGTRCSQSREEPGSHLQDGYTRVPRSRGGPPPSRMKPSMMCGTMSAVHRVASTTYTSPGGSATACIASASSASASSRTCRGSAGGGRGLPSTMSAGGGRGGAGAAAAALVVPDVAPGVLAVEEEALADVRGRAAVGGAPGASAGPPTDRCCWSKGCSGLGSSRTRLRSPDSAASSSAAAAAPSSSVLAVVARPPAPAAPGFGSSSIALAHTPAAIWSTAGSAEARASVESGSEEATAAGSLGCEGTGRGRMGCTGCGRSSATSSLGKSRGLATVAAAAAMAARARWYWRQSGMGGAVDPACSPRRITRPPSAPPTPSIPVTGPWW